MPPKFGQGTCQAADEYDGVLETKTRGFGLTSKDRAKTCTPYAHVAHGHARVPDSQNCKRRSDRDQEFGGPLALFTRIHHRLLLTQPLYIILMKTS